MLTFNPIVFWRYYYQKNHKESYKSILEQREDKEKILWHFIGSLRIHKKLYLSFSKKKKD